MKYRKLGNTGIDISALGFGTMRLPEKNGKIDTPEAVRIIRTAIDEGVNYLDTAYFYHNGESEILVGKALGDGYRNKAYIATKSPMYKIKSEDDFDKILDEQLKKLDVEHIDFYLLHAINLEKWNDTALRFDLGEKMLRAKKSGKIGHIGFSFHDNLDAFKTIVDGFDAWEFCQIQLNYIDTQHQAGLEGLKYAADRGLGVIIMEPLLGGKLANPTDNMKKILSPEKSPVLWAFDYLWNMPEVSFLLSGMSNMQQVCDNLEYARGARTNCLSQDDLKMLDKVRDVFLNSSLVPCTKCEYCMPCPFGLNIPSIFEAYNNTVAKSESFAKKQYDELETGADECTACRKCEEVCPQNIKISGEMPKIAETFERV